MSELIQPEFKEDMKCICLIEGYRLYNIKDDIYISKPNPIEHTKYIIYRGEVSLSCEQTKTYEIHGQGEWISDFIYLKGEFVKGTFVRGLLANDSVIEQGIYNDYMLDGHCCMRFVKNLIFKGDFRLNKFVDGNVYNNGYLIKNYNSLLNVQTFYTKNEDGVLIEKISFNPLTSETISLKSTIITIDEYDNLRIPADIPGVFLDSTEAMRKVLQLLKES